MSSLLYSYDYAIKMVLYSKFASILGIDTQSSSAEDNINLGIFQVPKEVAQRVAAEKRGATFLEYINFWRTGASFSWSRNRTSLSRRGFQIGSDIVKAVPIDLNYNAWFWSKDLDKIYQIIEDYIFWQQNNPNISLVYNDSYELTPDLHFGEIVDESTVSEQYTKGIIHVYKMPIKLDAWVLTSTSFQAIQKIKCTIRDKDEVTDYEEIIVEDSDQDTEFEAILRFSREAIYAISDINLETNSIIISGNFAADFIENEELQITDSTGNDNVYMIVGSSYADGKTSVIVSEVLVDSTADGTVSLKTTY